MKEETNIALQEQMEIISKSIERILNFLVTDKSIEGKTLLYFRKILMTLRDFSGHMAGRDDIMEP